MYLTPVELAIVIGAFIALAYAYGRKSATEKAKQDQRELDARSDMFAARPEGWALKGPEFNEERKTWQIRSWHEFSGVDGPKVEAADRTRSMELMASSLRREAPSMAASRRCRADGRNHDVDQALHH
jgi:hypothetical protein